MQKRLFILFFVFLLIFDIKMLLSQASKFELSENPQILFKRDLELEKIKLNGVFLGSSIHEIPKDLIISEDKLGVNCKSGVKYLTVGEKISGFSLEGEIFQQILRLENAEEMQSFLGEPDIYNKIIFYHFYYYVDKNIRIIWKSDKNVLERIIVEKELTIYANPQQLERGPSLENALESSPSSLYGVNLGFESYYNFTKKFSDADSLSKINELENAITNFKEALSSEPFNVEGRFRLANLYVKKRDILNARKQYRIIVALCKNNPEHYTKLINYAKKTVSKINQIID